MMKNLALIASAMMMTSAPVAAFAAPTNTSAVATNPASSLSLSPNARASVHGKHKSDLFGASIVVVVLALAAVGAGAAAAAGAFNSSSN